MFFATWAEAQTRQRLSSDNFDKGILTCSSAGLVLSLALIKDVVPLKTAIYPWLLFTSWVVFVVAISVTMISFLISYKASEDNANNIYELYLNGNEGAENKHNWRNGFILWGNRVAVSTFVCGVAAASLFVAINLMRPVENEKIEYRSRGTACFHNA